MPIQIVDNSGICVPAASNKTIYVSPSGGSDTTGDGSSCNPFATIAKANSIVSGATIYVPWSIVITDGGIYTEGGGTIHLLPNVYLFGRGATALQIQNTVVVDTVAAADGAVGINNITFVGPFTYDGSTANTATLLITNAQIQDLTWIVDGNNFGYLQATDGIFSSTLTTTGYVNLFSCELYATWTIQDAVTPTILIGSDIQYASIVLNGNTNLVMAGNDKLSALTAANTATVTTDSSSVPASITGTPTVVLTDNAPTLGYSPSAAGNWAGSPTNVQDAIDRIAAVVSVGGGVPIP